MKPIIVTILSWTLFWQNAIATESNTATDWYSPRVTAINVATIINSTHDLNELFQKITPIVGEPAIAKVARMMSIRGVQKSAWLPRVKAQENAIYFENGQKIRVEKNGSISLDGKNFAYDPKLSFDKNMLNLTNLIGNNSASLFDLIVPRAEADPFGAILVIIGGLMALSYGVGLAQNWALTDGEFTVKCSGNGEGHSNGQYFMVTLSRFSYGMRTNSQVPVTPEEASQVLKKKVKVCDGNTAKEFQDAVKSTTRIQTNLKEQGKIGSGND